MRSERNYGMGDFGDLWRLVGFCAETGGSTVLLNPLHALFPDAPEHASPYSPSSRSWFNPLYLDVEAMADFDECEEARALVLAPQTQAQLRALRATDQVDYRGVAEMKTRVLDSPLPAFPQRSPGPEHRAGGGFSRVSVRARRQPAQAGSVRSAAGALSRAG